MHGKDITIPKGTEVPTFVNGNFPLELTKFQSGTQSAVQTTQATAPATVSFTSSPVGAEISIDQAFVGNTPSAISVSAGKHTMSVKKEGYKAWEREITVSGGTVNLNADLVLATETAPAPETANTAIVERTQTPAQSPSAA